MLVEYGLVKGESMPVMTEEVSKSKMEQCLRQMKKDLAWYLEDEPEINYPSIGEIDGVQVLMWESGFDDWAYDYSSKLQEEVGGIEVSPYTSWALRISKI